MKTGSIDKQVILLFTESEIELLKENSGNMAVSFGLDDRINELEGESKMGLYYWDLECLEMAIGDLKNGTEHEKVVANGLYVKITEAMDYIDQLRNGGK